MTHTADVKTPRICVLGLGNLMRTDDAVGMLTTRLLEADDRLPNNVVVIEGGTLGLDLLGRLDGFTHLLVLDAVDHGAAPGMIMRFEGEAIARIPTSTSVHLLGLSDLINVLRLMDAPAMEIVLIGVQPLSTEWGTELTPDVAMAQNDLLEATLQEIARWTGDSRCTAGVAPGVACTLESCRCNVF